MKKNFIRILSITAVAAISLGLLSGCNQGSKAPTESTSTDISTSVAIPSDTSQEPVTEEPLSQNSFQLPGYRFAELAKVSAVSEDQFRLDSAIGDLDTDYTGVTFHSLAFTVQFDLFEGAIFSEIKVYDRETGEELNDTEETYVYRHVGYAPTPEFIAENPVPGSVIFMLPDEGNLTATCVMNSFKDYALEDLKIAARFLASGDQPVEFEITPNATPEEINTAPAYTNNASLIKLDGRYWTMLDADGGGGQRGHTRYDIKGLACISDPFSKPTLNLDSGRMVLVDEKTGEQVQLPDGAAPSVTTDAGGRGEISIGFGFITDDEAVYEVAAELLEDCNPGIIDDDGNIIVLD